MTRLFEPIRIGNIQLKHRVAMAPLTRCRADENHVQLPMALEYYCQRASVPGTLIITESTLISPDHAGFPHAPGIWTDNQIAAWKQIVDAVHARGCSIICQIVAPGRAADDQTLRADAGHGIRSSSAIPLTDGAPVPEPMTEEHIQSTIRDFTRAAENAVAAGFDGVEVHGANGYLVDQFLQDTCNQRDDRWGGSVENRARFGLEVTRSIADAIGADKLGYRISPWSTFQGMRMADPIPQFSYLVGKLKELNIAYLHIIESRVMNFVDVEKVQGIEFVLDIWGKTSPVLVAGGFDPKSAKHAVDEEYKGYEVAIVFGRHFLANPDLPFRIRHGLDLNKYDRTTFYTPQSPQGYLDYEFSPEFLAKELETAADDV